MKACLDMDLERPAEFGSLALQVLAVRLVELEGGARLRHLLPRCTLQTQVPLAGAPMQVVGACSNAVACMHHTKGCCCCSNHLQACVRVMSIKNMPGDCVSTQVMQSFSWDCSTRPPQPRSKAHTTGPHDAHHDYCSGAVSCSGWALHRRTGASHAAPSHNEHIRNGKLDNLAAQQLRIVYG